ncbi:MAG: hypothetical protein HDR43_02120 [Mycoplasma sp.]|nr:hypothetical protein [Mycoplasma sp.]
MSRGKIKMRLGSYIAIAITTLIFFIAAWILGGSIPSDNSNNIVWGIVSALIFVVLILQLISISIRMLISSIRKLISFRKEKGLWKILTLCFGIGLTLFAALIILFAIVWIIFVINNGLTQNNGEGFNGWCDNQVNTLKVFIMGNKSATLSNAPFGLFVTTFIFILIWSCAGIVYEILKKILGGNRRKEEEPVQN